MRRKLFGLTLGGLVFALSISAEGQPQVKIPRIAVLTSTTVVWQIEALRQGLAELGYVEGKNLVIEVRSAEGKLDRLPELATELVRLKPDIIVSSSNPAIIALKRATQSIPIIMTSVGDPVGAGFVSSLAHPGGNITGLSNIAEQLSGKRLELLKEIHPKIARIAILRNPRIPTHTVLWNETETAAMAMGIKLIAADFRASGEFEVLFGAMVRDRADALIVLPDPIVLAGRAQLAELASTNRLPAIYPFGEFVDAGGLMAYGPSHFDLWRRGSQFVDKILKGRKPADLPIEQPKKFEFIINLKAGKQIGLTIPPNVLARADRVIK
jgi:putative ABC transport system substrate-binding protein